MWECSSWVRTTCTFAHLPTCIIKDNEEVMWWVWRGGDWVEVERGDYVFEFVRVCVFSVGAFIATKYSSQKRFSFFFFC